MHLLLLLLLVSLAPSPSTASIATLVTLTDYLPGGKYGEFNARSLDGSPYELWYSPATSPVNSTRWVIGFQGGGWCSTLASCADRAYNPTNCYLGSTNASCFNVNSLRCANKSSAMSFECIPACNGARWCGGLFVNSSTTNPITHDWNQVLLPYHDGQSFTGGMEGPTMTTYAGQTLPLWFRGHANLQAALHYLINVAGMGGATEVGLTGNSAGGLATFFHADELAGALPPTTRVWAAPDSGFFYSSDPSYPAWQDSLRAMVAMANSTAGLDATCVGALHGDPASCAFPEVVAAHVTTPLFVMQGRYDPTLMAIIAGIPPSNASAFNNNGRELVELLDERVLNRPTNAAFVTACAEHCGQWAQGVDGDFNVTIAGVSAVPALAAWRAAGSGTNSTPLPPRNSWVQENGVNAYPCPGCCKGGPVAPNNVSLVLLEEAAKEFGAFSLDGSPGAMYIDVGPEKGKWIVYQQGGGWCSSVDQCRERANTTLGTSTLLPRWSTTAMREVDYLSNDPSINPIMYNWTRVYLAYTDGFSQMGDVEAPIPTGPPHNATIYYRGARVLKAQQAYLRAAGLGSATELVVSGCSAGGLSTYLNVDKWAEAFPSARVTGMADSGFFLNYDWTTKSPGAGQPGDPSFPSNASYPWRMWWMYGQLGGNTSAMSAPCMAAQAPGSEWLCLFAESVAPFLRSPLFALQSYYDSYQIGAILHANATSPNVSDVNAFGQLLNARLKSTLLKPGGVGHGAALDACQHHCGNDGTIWPTLPFSGNTTVQNAAWASWWGGGDNGTVLWEQVASYKCLWCCGTRVTR